MVHQLLRVVRPRDSLDNVPEHIWNAVEHFRFRARPYNTRLLAGAAATTPLLTDSRRDATQAVGALLPAHQRVALFIHADTERANSAEQRLKTGDDAPRKAGDAMMARGEPSPPRRRLRPRHLRHIRHAHLCRVQYHLGCILLQRLERALDDADASLRDSLVEVGLRSRRVEHGAVGKSNTALDAFDRHSGLVPPASSSRRHTRPERP